MLDFLVDDPADDAAEVSAPAVPGSLDDALRGHIEAALRATGGNIRRTAAALGISRNTLRARMDKYGLRHREAALQRAAADPRQPPKGLHRPSGNVAISPSSAPGSSRRRPSTSLAPLEVIAEKVRSFGGRIEDSGPTGLMAVFGLEPVDNAPSHAALAALAIHTAARARARRSSGRAGRRDRYPLRSPRRETAGLHGHIAVDGKAATWPILEDLVAVDRPGAIVVTEAVVPFVTRRFVLERLRDPGRDAWVLLRRETAPVAWTRLVGRSSELALLGQASARAEQGHGQIVSIVGEAGVGKSRLLHEAVRQLHGWLVPVLRRRALRHEHVLFPARGGAQELLPRPGHRYRGRGAGASRAIIAARGRRSGCGSCRPCSTCWGVAAGRRVPRGRSGAASPADARGPPAGVPGRERRAAAVSDRRGSALDRCRDPGGAGPSRQWRCRRRGCSSS